MAPRARRPTTDTGWKMPADLALPPKVAEAARFLGYARNPDLLRPGNRVTVLRGGGETYPSMLAAIAAAREHVHLETYIFEGDKTGRRFVDALCERARAGVEVRLIYDAVGSIMLPDGVPAELRAAGVQVLEFRPIAPWRARWGPATGRRDHRKILVVDGRVGFLGGLNIADEYDSVANGGGGWHDVHARVEGPAVEELARLFRRNWLSEGAPYFAFTPPPALEAVAADGTAFSRVLANGEKARAQIRQMYLHALRQAKQAVSIMNAYFIPDRGLIRTLANAAERGVAVRIIVPSSSDVKAIKWAGSHMFTRLLKRGVRIFEWTGRMMHAKTAVVDSVWATIGSYNLDNRSLFFNLEVVLQVVDPVFGVGMQGSFERDLEGCKEIVLETWKRRPFWHKMIAWFFYQLRHWL